MSWRSISISRSPSPRDNYRGNNSLPRSPQVSLRRPTGIYRRSVSPHRSLRRSPLRRESPSPYRQRNSSLAYRSGGSSLRKSPAANQRNRSSFRAISRSPEQKRGSLSPQRKRSQSPKRRRASRSPLQKRKSRSPRRKKNQSPRRWDESVSGSRKRSHSSRRTRRSLGRRSESRLTGRKWRSRRKRRSRRSARRVDSSSSSSESRSPRRSRHSRRGRPRKRYNYSVSTTSSSSSCISEMGRVRRNGRGELFRIGDTVEIKLRHQGSGVFPAKIADIKNTGLEYGVLYPERRRMEEFVRQERQAAVERDRIQVRVQLAEEQKVPFKSSKVELSKRSRQLDKTKANVMKSRSQPAMKHVNATAPKVIFNDFRESSRNTNSGAATSASSRKRAKSLPGDSLYPPKPNMTWAKFFAEFARDFFYPEVSPKYKESRENNYINIKPPYPVALSFDREVRTNYEDFGEEKEPQGDEEKSAITDHYIPETETERKVQYPEINLINDMINAIGGRSMNINIYPDNPRRWKPATGGWSQQFNVKISRVER